ncbi:Imprinted and ancient [Mycena kentingensis (nom. inval.)]|nr:Imprinted and ancient [Mycena kentingensis (nom. inval.)]
MPRGCCWSPPDDVLHDLPLTSLRRRSPVQSPARPAVTSTPVAISPPVTPTSSSSVQHVPPLNNPVVFRPPSPAPRFNGFNRATTESSLSTPSQNVSINTISSTRTRVTVQYGLPRNLPPAPRPLNSRKPTPPKPTNTFAAMRNNYLSMLANKTTSDTPAAAAPSVTAEDAQAKAFKAIAELTGMVLRWQESIPRSAYPTPPASPEFQSLGDHFPEDFANDPLIDFAAPFQQSPLFGGDESPFLTSPHDSMLDDFGTSPLDTPFSEFLSTPMMGMDGDFMESPLIGANDTNFMESPLFDFTERTPPTPSVVAPASTVVAKLPAKQTTFSPSTPTLESMDSPAMAAPRRRNVTGTRKNLTPDSLLGMDAPTQKRTYAAPSATSRKALPAGFVRKRGFATAFGIDEVEAETLPELSPTASEQEQIEWKRRQNTLAARKSRKRKLEHQQQIEAQVDDLKREVTMWRERALMAQEMLRGAGIKFNLEAMGE